MNYLVYLLIITHPAGYGEIEHKYPMPDLATCQSILKDSKHSPETEAMTCVMETRPTDGGSS
jgi:hypothetical protein